MKSDADHCARAGARRSNGFTLVELLVVVSIIALLISILLPSLKNARKQAKKLACQTNERSLSMASFTYYTEWGVYPPSVANFPVGQRNQGGIDWLGIGDQYGNFQAGDPDDPQSGVPKGFSAAPRFGVIFEFVKDEKAYLCVEDREGPSENSILGGGGNGKFSYTMFAALGLRAPETVIPRNEVTTSGGSRSGPTTTSRRLPRPAMSKVPLFVEEHPYRINPGNGGNGNAEGNFNTANDYVVSRHPPYRKRVAYLATGEKHISQGTTNIGFADGHVEGVAVNFGADTNHYRNALKDNRSIIPYNAAGLLYYYGLDGAELVIGD